MGLAVAIPSGAGRGAIVLCSCNFIIIFFPGVALATCEGGGVALVGVAISAALLPPVCNAGSLLAYGIILSMRPDLNTNSTYSDELFRALFSFCLFLMNFVSIFITALIFYRIKGIKPGNNFVRCVACVYQNSNTRIHFNGQRRGMERCRNKRRRG